MCTLCHAPDHRANHHSLAALDYAGQSGLPVAQGQAGAAPGGGGGQLASAHMNSPATSQPQQALAQQQPSPTSQGQEAGSRRCRFKGGCWKLRAGTCPFEHTPEEVAEARAKATQNGNQGRQGDGGGTAIPAPSGTLGSPGAGGQGGQSQGNQEKGRGKGSVMIKGQCNVCGKARKDHDGGNYCKRQERAAVVGGQGASAPASAAGPAQPQAARQAQSQVAAPNGAAAMQGLARAAPARGDHSLAMYDLGNPMGYVESAHSMPEQALGGTPDFLCYLTGEPELDRVCAGVSQQRVTLGDLFEEALKRDVAKLGSLDELPDSEFTLHKYARPPGYCAQTILHFGKLAVMSLLDYGATCSGMPEEVAIGIISHALRRIEEGGLQQSG